MFEIRFEMEEKLWWITFDEKGIQFRSGPDAGTTIIAQDIPENVVRIALGCVGTWKFYEEGAK